MGGACGYGNLYWSGYGTDTVALSSPLFDDGASCGQCFKVTCDADASQWCLKGRSVTVTATNLCPPNYAITTNGGGWCNPPRPHFDMSQPAWEHIGIYRAGIIPVLYQRYALHYSCAIVIDDEGCRRRWPPPLAKQRNVHMHEHHLICWRVRAGCRARGREG